MDPTAKVFGWESVDVGSRVVLSEGVIVNAVNKPSNETQVKICDCSYFGRFNYIAVGNELRVGAFFLSGPFCELLGTDHASSDPNIPYCYSGCTSGSIEIETNCWMGSGARILKNVVIGRGSIIGAGAVVTKSVPPFSVVVGNPGRILKRFSYRRGIWIPLSLWDTADEIAVPDEQTYLENLMRKYGHRRHPVGMADSRKRWI